MAQCKQKDEDNGAVWYCIRDEHTDDGHWYEYQERERLRAFDEAEREIVRLGQQEGTVDLGTVRRAFARLRGKTGGT